MEKLLVLIEEEVKAAFCSCGCDEKYAKVVLSNRPDLCEYQCNGALAAAKVYRKKPFDIASAAAGELSKSPVFSSAAAAMPGFINLKIDGAYLASYLGRMYADGRLGLADSGEGRTIIVDYGGANVAKPLHVGHLRSAVIGECVKRLGVRLGYNMIGDVHLGDWGLQMGLIIEELRDRQPDLVYFDENYTGAWPSQPPFTIGDLEEIYPAASAKAGADPAFKARAHEATAKLQSGYAPFMAVWRHILAVSVADLKKNYDSLDVHFELWKGESDAQPYIPGLIDDLVKKGLARESQGALVVDIAEPGDSRELPPCIVRKSDGAALYATSDLGTILEREKLYAPSKYIYITDKRQALHFTQVFRVARRAGYVKPETGLIHIGFGTVNGRDGRALKTRDGGVMRLEYLVSDINNAVLGRILENRENVTEEDAGKTAGIIGLAALKYGDLSNQAAKDYVFDIDRFTAFEGNTGPYILYTIVRIASILEKYAAQGGTAGKDILPAETDTQKSLMLLTARYSEVMETAFAECAPHRLCQYVYELSDAFNSFYHETKILTEPDAERRAGYVALIGLVREVLLSCIDVLGFSAPAWM